MSTYVKTRYESYWTAEAPPPLSDPLAASRLELLRSCLHGVRATRLLDAGCGSGALARALLGDGYVVAGMDVAGAALERAAETAPGAEFHEHSVEDLPWPVGGRSQDVVVSFEVIEHLLHPERLVAGARDALRTGGHLALTTPYHGRAKNVVLSLVAFDKHFDALGDHVRFFSDAALRSLLEREGFVVERLHHLGRFRPLWENTFVWARKR